MQVPLAAAAYDRMAFHDAAAAATALSRRGNLYLQETAPWSALKKVWAHPQEAANVPAHTLSAIAHHLDHLAEHVQHPRHPAAAARAPMQVAR